MKVSSLIFFWKGEKLFFTMVLILQLIWKYYVFLGAKNKVSCTDQRDVQKWVSLRLDLLWKEFLCDRLAEMIVSAIAFVKPQRTCAWPVLVYNTNIGVYNTNIDKCCHQTWVQILVFQGLKYQYIFKYKTSCWILEFVWKYIWKVLACIWKYSNKQKTVL